MKSVFAAEWRKQRPAALLLPLCSGPLLIFAACWTVMLYLTKNGRTAEQAFTVLYELCTLTWSYLIIFVVMMFTLLVSGVEHKSGMWPVLLSTPHAKWKHFFVKVILATLLVQLFGLILWLLMGGLGFIFGETFPEPLLYTAFLFALPFVVFQTSASVVVENPYISVSIGMAVFLFHAVLPYWWLPWGPLAELLQAGTQANSLLPVLMLVSTLGYGMLSLLTFYQKTFSSGGE